MTDPQAAALLQWWFSTAARGATMRARVSTESCLSFRTQLAGALFDFLQSEGITSTLIVDTVTAFCTKRRTCVECRVDGAKYSPQDI
jgi:hypothetical protein